MAFYTPEPITEEQIDAILTPIGKAKYKALFDSLSEQEITLAAAGFPISRERYEAVELLKPLSHSKA